MRRKKCAMWWPFRRTQPQPPKFAPPTGPVTYVESDSGFRYRILESTVNDGYDAAAAQLLPGERLYRMMDGRSRVLGRLFPILIDDEASFAQSVDGMTTRGWEFHLIAGISRATQA